MLDFPLAGGMRDAGVDLDARTIGEQGRHGQPDDRRGVEWTTVDLKKVGIIVGVIFALFFVISQPQGSADFVLNILYILRDAGNAVVQFISALF